MTKTVRIVSDGRGRGTKVYDTESGQEIHGISSVAIRRIVPDDTVVADVTFLAIEVDVTAEMRVGLLFADGKGSGPTITGIKAITFENGETVEF